MVADQADSSTPCSRCVACNAEISPSRNRGVTRKYCNEACRKKAGRIARATQSGLPGGGSPGRADRGGDRSEVRPGRPPQAGLPGGGEAVSEIPDAGFSWYYAKFAAAPGQDPFFERRVLRAELLHTLREVTTVDRCKACGWQPLGQAVVLKAGMTGDRKTAGFGGLERCGRIWLCPECAAKIRLRRGEEIAEAMARHLDNDGFALFWTVAIPHEQGDALKIVFNVLTELIRLVKSGRPHQRDRKRLGILGDIKAIEVTHGRNGWHPHAHILIIFSRVLTWEEWTTYAQDLDRRVADGLHKLGWNPGKPGVRSTVMPVDKGKGLAQYVTKVQEKGLGNEIARADLKAGRKGGRTPFEILRDFGQTGLVDDLELWWEYEKATAGRSAIRWSRGLRAILLPDAEEQTDEQIAAEEQAGKVVAHVTFPVWAQIRRDPQIRLACEFAAAEHGWEGLLRTLIHYRISTDGVYTPEDWASPNEVDLESV